MRSKVAIGVLLGLLSGVACSSLAPDTYSLTGNEKKLAIGIAEHRQDIQFRRQVLGNDYTASQNRLNEEENKLNIEAAKLCFELKKAHKLNPSSMYSLDEWNGELKKLK